MYAESAYFAPHDPYNTMLSGGEVGIGDGGGGGELAVMGSRNLEEKLRIHNFSPEHHHHNPSHEAAAAASGLYRQLGFDAKQELNSNYYYHHHHQQCIDPAAFSDPSVLQLPSISFNHPNNNRVQDFHGVPPDVFGEVPADSPSPASTVLYDTPPSVHWNLRNNLQHPSMVGDVMIHSLPHEYGFLPGGSLFDGVDEGCYVGQSAVRSVFGLGGEMGAGLIRRGEVRGNNTAEKQRRGKMGEKFYLLRSLIPNPLKNDRASIVAEATDYINELLRTIDELKILVEKKRRRREGSKKLMMGDGVAAAADDRERSFIQTPAGGRDHCPSNGLMRNSWLQRKFKDTSVDVRIVEDEVNIKLTQRKKVNCLLFVAKVLHELQLELLHMAAGFIGDSHIFMINTKIDEGSSVYASAIAKKLIEAMDGTVSSLAC